MRDADPERIVYRSGDAIVHSQRGALRQPVETLDAGFAAPGAQTKRIKVVDTIGYAEPLHQRHESDAAGHDEDRRVIAKTLQHPAQPAEESLDTGSAILGAQHTLEENRQFVDHQENAFVVFRAATEQAFAMASPVPGVQSGPDLHANAARAEFLDGSHCPWCQNGRPAQ